MTPRLVLAAIGLVGFVLVPRVGFGLARRPQPRRAPALPWIAVVVLAASWRFPGPEIEGSETFVQHALGGSACALVALFLSLNVPVRGAPLRVVAAFAVAATFGTAVELVELAYDVVEDTDLTGDTSIDLLANSVGAVSTALVLEGGLAAWRARRSRLRAPRRTGR